MNNNMISKTIGMFFLGMLGIAVLTLIASIPTWLLWNNCLASAIDGVNKISLFQAIGINFLFSILFKPTTITTKNE